MDALLSNVSEDDLPASRDLSGPLVDIQRRVEQADQPLIGLGLGRLTENSLCSSSSISHLHSAANADDDEQPNIEVKGGCVDDRRSSRGMTCLCMLSFIA